jgi:hypothetical protein
MSHFRKLDMDLETSVSKILKDDDFEVNRPVHLSITVDSHLTASSFTEVKYMFVVPFVTYAMMFQL